MNFLKKHKNKIIFGAVVLIALAVAFAFGESPSQPTKSEEMPIPAISSETHEINTAPLQKEQESKENPTFQQTENEPVKNEVEITNNTQEEALKCTLSVKCDAILNNLSSLNPEKTDLVPADGIIFPETEIVFYEGESVFNVLSREMKKNKIHIEFTVTPMYNTAYIEGISNLYEKDCGDLSGWTYKVNGKVPQTGCSNYILMSGDKIEWVYTCSLGKDIA